MGHNRTQLSLFLLPLAIAPALSLPPAQQKDIQSQKRKYSFTENCADTHDKDFVSCIATSVDCNVNLEALLPPPEIDIKSVYPSEAHDIRIETFAKAMPAKADGGGQTHQLLVDITWQTPPNNSTRALKAFLLEIEGERERKHACFLLNVSGTEWTPEKVALSPRLHFTSNSLFSFSQSYEVELYSLPEKSAGAGASIHTRFTTPTNPSGNSPLSAGFVPTNCSKHSNQFASKWTAGFRHIYVHSAARVMQVEFVGAPPQFCFESYEVRLLDETGLELLFSGTVHAEEMHRNGSMAIGQFNFTDLEYDRMYIPSVIPVERAVDGRCLCPVFGSDPYDVKVVCSCVAADWRPIRMTRPDVVKLCADCKTNHSLGLLSPPIEFTNPTTNSEISMMWPLFVLFNALFLLLLCIFIIGYLRFRSNGQTLSKGQFQAVRFVPPSQKERTDQREDNSERIVPRCLPSSTASSLAVHSNFGLGTVSTASLTMEPLISAYDSFEAPISDICPQNVLIVYSHDSDAHERAVIALAEFLRNVFLLNVSLDRWNLRRIEQNMVDWLSSSVVSADKVLVVNSAGALERYRTKAFWGASQIVEKVESDPLDRIFIAHIDMALQHHSLVSVRFIYTEPKQTLPMLNGRLQYILPDNICPLVSAIFGRNMRRDERLSPSALSSCESIKKLREAITEMASLCAKEPNWLDETHQCRRRLSILVSDGEMKASEMTECRAKKAGSTNAEDLADNEEKSTHTELIPLYNSEQQNNSGKMDSGIFEWTGSDGEAGGATTADREKNNEKEDTDSNYENHSDDSTTRTRKRAIENKLPNCTEKEGSTFIPKIVTNDEMDSGLVADMSSAAEKTPTFSVAVIT
ncbi:hypothetical protein niasHS_003528 [Heterodera schachtii]|uniref:SEFIR domain-containing protein n=1 Tax=Heterodera schachtii TaxID=97005 RepID=A0ABD2KGS8_HETSC